jgi:hypothetical protein
MSDRGGAVPSISSMGAGESPIQWGQRLVAEDLPEALGWTLGAFERLPEVHRETLDAAERLPEDHRETLRAAESLPEAHRETLRAAESLPEAHRETLRAAESLPEAHRETLRAAERLAATQVLEWDGLSPAAMAVSVRLPYRMLAILKVPKNQAPPLIT